MPVTPIIVCVATFCSTLLGGLFAMRFKDRLHLILGFSAGAVIGVAFFDLIPEAMELSEGHFHASTIMSIAAAGFIGYMILDRVMMFHGHSHTEEDHALHAHAEDDHDHDHAGHHHAAHGRGQLGAISLSIHSFLDGVGIGLAYQVSPAVAAVVTVAVLTHDFSDGINTVNLILKDKGERRRALRWLFIDAVAPVLGMISTLFFSLPQAALAVVLAVFAGFFLYIGASDLLPESHHRHPKALTTVMTVVGVAVLYVVVKIAG